MLVKFARGAASLVVVLSCAAIAALIWWESRFTQVLDFVYWDAPYLPVENWGRFAPFWLAAAAALIALFFISRKTFWICLLLFAGFVLLLAAGSLAHGLLYGKTVLTQLSGKETDPAFLQPGLSLNVFDFIKEIVSIGLSLLALLYSRAQYMLLRRDLENRQQTEAKP